MTEGFSFTVPGGRGAAASARRAFTSLDGVVTGRARDEVLLLLSELVTNAVIHGDAGQGQPLNVQVEIDAELIRVEVRDHGPGFPSEPPRRRPHEPGGLGLGLVLVESLAGRWGVERADGATCVWFEYSRA